MIILNKKTMFISGYSNISYNEKNSPIITFFINPNICQLDCYGCLNKFYFNNKNSSISYYTLGDLVDLILLSKHLYINTVRFSGGEVLIVFSNIKEDIENIKRLCNVKIAIETNGQSWKSIVDNIEFIKENVSEFFLDIKSAPKIKSEKTLKIIGNPDVDLYFRNLEETIFLLKKYNIKFFSRTIKYPLFDNKDLNIIEEYVDNLNITNWYINENFIKIN